MDTGDRSLRRDDEGEELGRDLISLLVEATHSKRTCCVSIFKFYFFFCTFLPISRVVRIYDVCASQSRSV